MQPRTDDSLGAKLSPGSLRLPGGPGWLVLLALPMVVGWGCGGDSDSAAGSSVGTPTGGAVDITNAILTRIDSDCGSYVDLYEAQAVDVGNARSFEAALGVSATPTQCALSSNAIPNHDFNAPPARFAHATTTHQRTFDISRSPVRASSPTALSHSVYDGVLLNGVPVDLLSAGCYRPGQGDVQIGCSENDLWLLDPLGPGNAFGADSHNAHTQPDGTYHYHGDPVALFDDSPGVVGSPVIGFAADGFPIRGSYFVDSMGTVRQALSGYSLKRGSRPAQPSGPGGLYDGAYIDDWEFTGGGDLDVCNGMEIEGVYTYFVIRTYPWIMNCHVGSPDVSFAK